MKFRFTLRTMLIGIFASLLVLTLFSKSIKQARNEFILRHFLLSKQAKVFYKSEIRIDGFQKESRLPQFSVLGKWTGLEFYDRVAVIDLSHRRLNSDDLVLLKPMIANNKNIWWVELDETQLGDKLVKQFSIGLPGLKVYDSKETLYVDGVCQTNWTNETVQEMTGNSEKPR